MVSFTPYIYQAKDSNKFELLISGSTDEDVSSPRYTTLIETDELHNMIEAVYAEIIGLV